MAVIEGTGRLSAGSLGSGNMVPAVAYYDFAVDGGAVGDIVLRGDTLPNGAIVENAMMFVDTAVTGGAGATLAVKIQAAADVQAAAVVTGAPWSTTGPKRASAVTATSAPKLLTQARQITATVAVGALTAGKLTVVLWYVTV